MESTKLSPSARLDYVLTRLISIEETMVEYHEILPENAPISIDQLPKIIQRLIDDHLVVEHTQDYEATIFGDPAFTHYWYYITFEGEAHQEVGGYVGKDRQRLSASRLEKRNERVLRYGAVGAAAGTICWLIWDMIKFYLEHHPCWKCL